MLSPGEPFPNVDRDILIFVSKDRTLTSCQRGSVPFDGVAFLVFSVDTPEQAERLIFLAGVPQYAPHPVLPNEPWRKIAIGFKKFLETSDVPEVSEFWQTFTR